MAAVAPVVDHLKRSTIQEIASKSPFNIFNIVAVVAILVIGYFLYRKFTQKFARGAIRMPVMPVDMMQHVSAPVEAVSEPIQENTVEEEVEENKED
jgi:hypothetical protein